MYVYVVYVEAYDISMMMSYDARTCGVYACQSKLSDGTLFTLFDTYVFELLIRCINLCRVREQQQQSERNEKSNIGIFSKTFYPCRIDW